MLRLARHAMLAVLVLAGARGSSGTEPLGYRRGSVDAPVVVVEFTDFGCHYCGDFAREVLPQVEREYVATGRVQWRMVPIATASTPHAREAAAAAICAGQGDRAWAMHDRLFSGQREWVHFGDPETTFTRYARALGLDATHFRDCLHAPATADTVAAMRRLAQQLGVRVAPTLFVAGRRVEGAVGMDDLRGILGGAR